MNFALQYLVQVAKESSPRIGIAIEEFLVKFEEATPKEKFTSPVGENATLEELKASGERHQAYQALLRLSETGLNFAYQLTRLSMEEQGKFLGMYIMNTIRAVTPERVTPQ